MSIEIILGVIGLVFAAIGGAFGLGHSRGKGAAEGKAFEDRMKEAAKAGAEVAFKRVQATKGASDVQQAVNHMSDDDVDRELRENFTRKT